jgi:hypothetical protein
LAPIPITRLFAKDTFLIVAEREILRDVAQFRADLRGAIFSMPEHSNAFVARVLKASGRNPTEGKLHGALLEVLTLDVAQAEADILNGLRVARTGSGKEAYQKLLGEIFIEQDTSVLDNRQFKWVARSSGTSFQDDVRLAAVEVDTDGRMVETSGYDHAYVSKVYECKSWKDSSSSSGQNLKNAVNEMLARAIQEKLDHKLVGQSVEVCLVMSKVLDKMMAFKGENMPYPLKNIFESLESLGFTHDKDAPVPNEWLFNRAHDDATYARFVFARDPAGEPVSPFNPTTAVAKGQQFVRIEFDCEVSSDGGKTWTTLHVTEIVTWILTPQQGLYHGYVDWLYTKTSGRT